jgi:GTP-binding protein HflX
VQEAALILQVADISSPFHAEQDAEVLKVLKDLGVDDRPRLHVLNKTDRLSEEDLAILKKSNGGHRQTVFTSAVTGAGLDELLAKIDAAVPIDPITRLQLRLPLSDGRNLSLLHAGGRVLHSAISDGHVLLDAEIPESLARRLEAFIWRGAAPAETNLDAGA